jgi:hypothetical protein
MTTKPRRRRDRPETVDVARDAREAICLEAFQPFMRRAVEKGERLPRDHDLVRSFPAYFGLLLPLSELEEANHGE